jgi:hypothetical protein
LHHVDALADLWHSKDGLSAPFVLGPFLLKRKARRERRAERKYDFEMNNTGMWQAEIHSVGLAGDHGTDFVNGVPRVGRGLRHHPP